MNFKKIFILLVNSYLVLFKVNSEDRVKVNMANYNNNDRNKGGYFDQYVNFDQFLMQHNINNWAPSRGPPNATTNTFQTFNGGGGGNQYHGRPFYFHPQSANANNAFSPPPPSSASSSNLVQNSNLTATASEFIPQQTSAVTSNSALAATASEFIPKNQQYDVKQHKTESKSTVSLATAAAAAAASFSLAPTIDLSVSCDKSKGDSASNTESVIQALSNTHISDGKTLNSSGGAIKKVRSQDYRNDSRERHSNGKLLKC